jgi:hypothetical protein
MQGRELVCEATAHLHDTGGGGMPTDDQAAQEYRSAYERWQRDLTQLHEVLLDGKPLDPLHRIALLRRESHSKDRYEMARARLIGLPQEEDESSTFPPE